MALRSDRDWPFGKRAKAKSGPIKHDMDAFRREAERMRREAQKAVEQAREEVEQVRKDVEAAIREAKELVKQDEEWMDYEDRRKATEDNVRNILNRIRAEKKRREGLDRGKRQQEEQEETKKQREREVSRIMNHCKVYGTEQLVRSLEGDIVSECQRCGICCATGACSYGKLLETQEHDYICGFLAFRGDMAVCLAYDSLPKRDKKGCHRITALVRETYSKDEELMKKFEGLKKERNITGLTQAQLDRKVFGLRASRFFRSLFSPFFAIARMLRRRKLTEQLKKKWGIS